MNLINELTELSKLPINDFILKLKNLEVDMIIGGYLKFADGLDVYDFKTGDIIFSMDF